MSRQSTRIMVLGIVAYRQPISGYGIEKTLAEWAVDRWTTIAPASVYQQLRTLGRSGLIEPVAGSTTRAAEFRCTSAGRDELHRLLLDLLEERDVRPLSLIPLLHFTPSLSTAELEHGLTARVAAIDAALAASDAMLARSGELAASHVMEIFRLTLHGLRADRDWCRSFLHRLADTDADAWVVETTKGPESP
ncbi:MAG TPA: PadR family transcriptional regulator [Lacisediminihabitans sp.]|nr:PadR family transcriptional regulator [Lacisediminihabitans sp.]HXD62482.1 PadR family transcriptional regulator [Lacisediminihabitans sp.]